MIISSLTELISSLDSDYFHDRRRKDHLLANGAYILTSASNQQPTADDHLLANGAYILTVLDEVLVYVESDDHLLANGAYILTAKFRNAGCVSYKMIISSLTELISSPSRPSDIGVRSKDHLLANGAYILTRQVVEHRTPQSSSKDHLLANGAYILTHVLRELQPVIG